MSYHVEYIAVLCGWYLSYNGIRHYKATCDTQLEFDVFVVVDKEKQTKSLEARLPHPPLIVALSPSGLCFAV